MMFSRDDEGPTNLYVLTFGASNPIGRCKSESSTVEIVSARRGRGYRRICRDARGYPRDGDRYHSPDRRLSQQRVFKRRHTRT